MEGWGNPSVGNADVEGERGDGGDDRVSNRADDATCIEALVEGDSDAWCRFVTRYQGLVCSRVAAAARECGFHLGPQDLEDLCAEVFVRLIENDFASLRQFEGRSSLGTWLAVVARRVFLRHMSRKRIVVVAGEVEGDDPQVFEPLQQTPSQLSELIRSEDAAQLHEMLQHLREGDQRILRMYHLERLSYHEISSRLSITLNAVGPKLHRAQQRLRQLLEGSECHDRCLPDSRRPS